MVHASCGLAQKFSGSTKSGLKSRGYRGQGRIMADSSGSGISEHGIAHFHNLLAQVFKD
jgi:carnitine monooxygenase subunit